MPASPAIFTFPNRVRFGEGAIAVLPAELATLGVERPLIVTDRGIVEAGIHARITQLLPDSVTFADVHANPTEADCLAGLERYRDGNCDGIIGLGGGSAIDAAKAIRLLATHPGPLADYDLTAGGSERIGPDLPPMAAIPTTSGTGSEASRGALIRLPQTGRKSIVLSPHLLPSVAICDPELTYGLPPGLTAGAGMDAFTHAIESYLSVVEHPICDAIALEALKHVARGIEPASLDGNDRTARRSLMLGALMAGISFHKGLGVVHSLAHALGAEGDAHHGMLNAVLLPHALRFNRQVAAPRLADLAAALGLGRTGDGPGHLIVLTELLLVRLPIPAKLGEFPGLSYARIPEYASLAMRDHCHRTNPRPCELADMIGILERAW